MNWFTSDFQRHDMYSESKHDSKIEKTFTQR